MTFEEALKRMTDIAKIYDLEVMKGRRLHSDVYYLERNFDMFFASLYIDDDKNEWYIQIATTVEISDHNEIFLVDDLIYHNAEIDNDTFVEIENKMEKLMDDYNRAVKGFEVQYVQDRQWK